ncbi:hypothetical protein V8E53_005680 [Lactarius tabidus]
MANLEFAYAGGQEPVALYIFIFTINYLPRLATQKRHSSAAKMSGRGHFFLSDKKSVGVGESRDAAVITKRPRVRRRGDTLNPSYDSGAGTLAKAPIWIYREMRTGVTLTGKKHTQ